MATLRIIRPEDSDVIPLERRREPRHTLTGRVTALQTEEVGRESHNRICPLELKDISTGGLGAIAHSPVDIGSRIVVFFPPHGNEFGFERRGKVVRCVDRKHGHEIGIAFDANRAAA